MARMGGGVGSFRGRHPHSDEHRRRRHWRPLAPVSSEESHQTQVLFLAIRERNHVMCGDSSVPLVSCKLLLHGPVLMFECFFGPNGAQGKGIQFWMNHRGQLEGICCLHMLTRVLLSETFSHIQPFCSHAHVVIWYTCLLKVHVCMHHSDRLRSQ